MLKIASLPGIALVVRCIQCPFAALRLDQRQGACLPQRASHLKLHRFPNDGFRLPHSEEQAPAVFTLLCLVMMDRFPAR
jgi:hypothetical protein